MKLSLRTASTAFMVHIPYRDYSSMWYMAPILQSTWSAGQQEGTKPVRKVTATRKSTVRETAPLMAPGTLSQASVHFADGDVASVLGDVASEPRCAACCVHIQRVHLDCQYGITLGNQVCK